MLCDLCTQHSHTNTHSHTHTYTHTQPSEYRRLALLRESLEAAQVAGNDEKMVTRCVTYTHNIDTQTHTQHTHSHTHTYIHTQPSEYRRLALLRETVEAAQVAGNDAMMVNRHVTTLKEVCGNLGPVMGAIDTK